MLWGAVINSWSSDDLRDTKLPNDIQLVMASMSMQMCTAITIVIAFKLITVDSQLTNAASTLRHSDLTKSSSWKADASPQSLQDVIFMAKDLRNRKIIVEDWLIDGGRQQVRLIRQLTIEENFLHLSKNSSNDASSINSNSETQRKVSFMVIHLFWWLRQYTNRFMV